MILFHDLSGNKWKRLWSSVLPKGAAGTPRKVPLAGWAAQWYFQLCLLSAPLLHAPGFFRLGCEPWPVGWTKEWAVWEMEEDLAEGPEPLWRLWLPRRDDPASC